MNIQHIWVKAVQKLFVLLRFSILCFTMNRQISMASRLCYIGLILLAFSRPSSQQIDVTPEDQAKIQTAITTVSRVLEPVHHHLMKITDEIQIADDGTTGRLKNMVQMTKLARAAGSLLKVNIHVFFSDFVLVLSYKL